MLSKCIKIGLLLFCFCIAEAFSQSSEAPSVQEIFRATDSSAALIQPTRTIPEAAIKKMKEDPDYWYADVVPPKDERSKSGAGFLQQQWVRTLIWIFVASAFVLIIVFYLRSSNLFVFSRQSKKLATAAEPAIEEDIFSLEYGQAIQQALNVKDFRMAVRLLFLQTLKRLHENGLISFAPEKTNAQYLADVRSLPQYSQFATLTQLFEHVWYGNFPVSEDRFEQIRHRFSGFQQQFSR